jgi:hypothetical protein
LGPLPIRDLGHPIETPSAPSPDGIWTRIGSLLGTFTPAEYANYLRNAGYAST